MFRYFGVDNILLSIPRLEILYMTPAHNGRNGQNKFEFMNSLISNLGKKLLKIKWRTGSEVANPILGKSRRLADSSIRNI